MSRSSAGQVAISHVRCTLAYTQRSPCALRTCRYYTLCATAALFKHIETAHDISFLRRSLKMEFKAPDGGRDGGSSRASGSDAQGATSGQGQCSLTTRRPRISSW